VSEARAEPLAKVLLTLTGFGLVFTGLAMFLVPELALDAFPWDASAFVAMTIGAWAVGLGALALDAAVGWTRKGLSRVYAAVLAVWLFCILELVVVVITLPEVHTDHWLTYPYVLGLVLGSLSGLIGGPILWRRRALVARQGTGTPRWLRAIYVVWAVASVAGAVAVLLIDTSRVGLVPEPLTSLSARAAAAMLVALAAGTLPMALTHDIEPAIQFARAGLYIDVLSVVAAAVWIGSFDVLGRPAGFAYLAAWLLAAALALVIVLWNRRAQSYVDVRWSHE
jgi:hypothetical protein